MNVWRINSDGSNLKQLSKGRFDTSPECSRDSKWAYYLDEDASPVGRVLLNGGAPEMSARNADPPRLLRGHYVDLSPDGKSVAFGVELGEANPVHKIAVIPLDAGPQPTDSHARSESRHCRLPEVLRPTEKHSFIRSSKMECRTCGCSRWTAPAGVRSRISRPIRSPDLRWSPDGKTLGVLSRRIDADVVLLRESSNAPQ